MDDLITGWKLLELIAKLPMRDWMEQVKKAAGRTYGLIHKSTAAEIHGVKGFLIWDYILYNEITFKDNNENIVSLYRGLSDRETEERWDELVKEFGV
ncbi:hypothetical protein IMSAGC019_02178 [Lachnospiraceae bacterium]|nr:hypothetical protein IMSAGC019_02178 [Lachnospiraceae bacterium]